MPSRTDRNRTQSDMAMVTMTNHSSLLLPLSQPGCCGRQLQQWATSTKMRRTLSPISVGRQKKPGKIYGTSCHGWSAERERFPSAKRRSLEGKRTQESRLVCGAAISTAVVATGSALVVAGAVYALTVLKKDTVPALLSKKECEVCAGSGLCTVCNGEGFVNKNLSPEAAMKARARAKDAATRYTAGLAKKWNYCTACSGQRGCQSCKGRGWTQ